MLESLLLSANSISLDLFWSSFYSLVFYLQIVFKWLSRLSQVFRFAYFQLFPVAFIRIFVLIHKLAQSICKFDYPAFQAGTFSPSILGK